MGIKPTYAELKVMTPRELVTWETVLKVREARNTWAAVPVLVEE